jgi:S-formylglutathione hydrolase
METVSETRAFGGVQGVYRHSSARTACEMTFALFMPGRPRNARVPCLWFLSGLTCTHENAMLKSGAQLWAARHGLAVVFPDTSPRGAGIADDDEYDLGQGAGFYVDATEEPWAPHYRMFSYIADDLQTLVTTEFPVELERQGITGHSMGGHGALTLAMRHPEIYRALSAFAPIANPMQSEWGQKQLAAYLGQNRDAWRGHDACELLRTRGWRRDMLVDQGAEDPFLNRLMPGALAATLAETRTPATTRLQAGYDHSYFFVASFMEDHVRWHAERL